MRNRAPKSFNTVVALHQEANNSDPFATNRCAHYLSRNYDIAERVGDEAQRVVAARKAKINEGFKDWKRSKARKDVMLKLFGKAV